MLGPRLLVLLNRFLIWNLMFCVILSKNLNQSLTSVGLRNYDDFANGSLANPVWTDITYNNCKPVCAKYKFTRAVCPSFCDKVTRFAKELKLDLGCFVSISIILKIFQFLERFPIEHIQMNKLSYRPILYVRLEL